MPNNEKVLYITKQNHGTQKYKRNRGVVFAIFAIFFYKSNF